MKAEIITIGDEILIGQTVDTNSAYIAGSLNSLGIEITGISTIPDDAGRIINALNEASIRSELIILTGGLGPTSDDITKKTLCEYFSTSLIRDSEVLANISELLGRRKVSLNNNNLAQADVPQSCTVLMNRVGTAPGMWFMKDGTITVSLPGVPYEMKYLIDHQVIPRLKNMSIGSTILHRNIMTYGLPEAHLAEMLTDFEATLPSFVKLAYLPSSGVIKLRLTARGIDVNSSAVQLESEVARLRTIIADVIYAEGEVTLEQEVGRLLSVNNLTMTTAESCTGGNIARMITSVPGSSRWYVGSVVAYSNDIKTGLLGVDKEIIRLYGAVSSECVKAMAEGARLITGASFSIAVTGIAGPDGGTAEKPVGTVWIATSDKNGTLAESFLFGSDRQVNIRRFSLAALNMLRKQIIRH
jgi:nicotinamide-nucleotide amidase